MMLQAACHTDAAGACCYLQEELQAQAAGQPSAPAAGQGQADHGPGSGPGQHQPAVAVLVISEAAVCRQHPHHPHRLHGPCTSEHVGARHHLPSTSMSSSVSSQHPSPAEPQLPHTLQAHAMPEHESTSSTHALGHVLQRVLSNGDAGTCTQRGWGASAGPMWAGPSGRQPTRLQA